MTENSLAEDRRAPRRGKGRTSPFAPSWPEWNKVATIAELQVEVGSHCQIVTSAEFRVEVEERVFSHFLFSILVRDDEHLHEKYGKRASSFEFRVFFIQISSSLWIK